METNNPLDGLVGALSQQILEQVSARVESSLQQTINNKINSIDIAAAVDKHAKSEAKIAAAQYEPNLNAIDQQLATATSAIVNNITATANKLVNEAITNHIRGIDFNGAIVTALNAILDQKLNNYSFPAESISSASIKFDKNISGDVIKGGIISEFASTGIDDKSSSIQVTVLDSHTVVENHLLSNEITINGTAKFNGNIELNGTIAETSPGFVSIVNASKDSVINALDDEFFAAYGKVVFGQIQQDGIDLSRVTLNGQEILKDNRLSAGIIDSNLQSLGVLRELQVKGETLMYNTLYTSLHRVGINTLEPNSALSVWDEEVEVNIGKKQQGMAFIGSNRDQMITIGTNGKSNLILTQDGAAAVSKLIVGNMSFTSSDRPPSFDAPKATVIFNANPSLGGPLGWVSLGNARWANFGIIE